MIDPGLATAVVTAVGTVAGIVAMRLRSRSRAQLHQVIVSVRTEETRTVRSDNELIKQQAEGLAIEVISIQEICDDRSRDPST